MLTSPQNETRIRLSWRTLRRPGDKYKGEIKNSRRLTAVTKISRDWMLIGQLRIKIDYGIKPPGRMR